MFAIRWSVIYEHCVPACSTINCAVRDASLEPQLHVDYRYCGQGHYTLQAALTILASSVYR